MRYSRSTRSDRRTVPYIPRRFNRQSHNIVVSKHCVDRYIEREWGFKSYALGPNAREIVKREIKQVIFNADTILYDPDGVDNVIYIGNGVAVPVDGTTATTSLYAERYRRKIESNKITQNDRGQA